MNEILSLVAENVSIERLCGPRREKRRHFFESRSSTDYLDMISGVEQPMTAVVITCNDKKKREYI